VQPGPALQLRTGTVLGITGSGAGTYHPSRAAYLGGDPQFAGWKGTTVYSNRSSNPGGKRTAVKSIWPHS